MTGVHPPAAPSAQDRAHSVKQDSHLSGHLVGDTHINLRDRNGIA